MKKILFFFNYPKNEYFGGIANIISTYTSNPDAFKKHSFDIDYLNPNISFSKNYLFSKIQKLFFLRREKKAIKKYFNTYEQANIFHIHSSRGWILYNDLKLAKYIKERFHVQVVVSIHFADLNSILLKQPFKKREIALLNCIDHIIVLSKKTKNELIMNGISQHKISVLYTFHSFQKELDSKNILSNTPPRLLFMGSLDERKGILDLISAISLLDDDFVLNVCGGFADKRKKEQLEHAFDSDKRVVFKGYVKGTEKEDIFNHTDIFVLPSYGEGMPIVIMEALYFGCAIVSTSVGAIPEIIHEENGFLIEPGNIEALSSVIHSLVSNQSVLNKLKKNNVALGKKFSLEENIKQLCHIYRRILDAE